MQSFCRSLIRKQTVNSSNIIASHFQSACLGGDGVSALKNHIFRSFDSHMTSSKSFGSGMDTLAFSNAYGITARLNLSLWNVSLPAFGSRSMTTAGNIFESTSTVPSQPITDVAPKIKFKRLDKTARNIMQILDKEAVQEVRTQRGIPDIRPGNIVQLKVEVPENKRRVSIVKGIVIARRNAGLNTTFRLRRLVAGVGVESLFPLYSPNIKEIKVLEKKKVRRAKLYYLRDKMNALKKQ